MQASNLSKKITSKSFVDKTWIATYLLTLFSCVYMTIFWFVDYSNFAETDPKYLTLIFFFLYFTIQSNLLSLFVSTYMVWGKKHLNSKWFRRAKEFMFCDMLLTGIVYWTLILPFSSNLSGPFWLANVLVHMVAPIATSFVFLIDMKAYKQVKLNKVKDAGWHSIYIVVWAILPLTFYFAFGGKTENAIYPFLDFVNKPIMSSIEAVLLVPIYYGLHVFSIWISNPKK